MGDLKINGFNVTPAEWAKMTSVFMAVDSQQTLNAVEDGELTGDEIRGLLKNVDESDFYRFTDKDVTGLYTKYLDAPQYSFAKDTFKNNMGFSLFVMENILGSNNDLAFSLADRSFLDDRDFALRLVSKKGAALEFLKDEFKSNKEIIVAAMANDPTAINFVDPADANRHQYFLDMLSKKGENLKDCPADVKGNSELVLVAVEDAESAIQYADESLRTSKPFILQAVEKNAWVKDHVGEMGDDKDIILAAVKKNRYVYENLSAEYKKDRDVIIMHAKIHNGKILESLGPEFRSDREVVLAAVTNYGRALEYVDDSLKNDPEIVLAASGNRDYYQDIRENKARLLEDVKEDSFAFAVASDELKEDRKFSDAMAYNNLNVFRFMTTRHRVAYWNFFVDKYQETFTTFFTDEELQTYEKFEAAMGVKYGIKFSRRLYGLDTMKEVLSNLQDPANIEDTRPRAVLVYNRTDWNGAFEGLAISTQLIGFGYRVMYYEAESDKDAVAVLEKATNGGEAKIDLLVFGGHGSEKSLSLGGTAYEESDIDTGDFSPNDELGLAKYLNENGQILLYACSTGEGGSGNPNNLVNTMARTLPETVVVFGATVPGGIAEIKKTKEGIDVTWFDGEPYKASGGKKP